VNGERLGGDSPDAWVGAQHDRLAFDHAAVCSRGGAGCGSGTSSALVA
jgi:hypothetical protein